MRCGRGHSARGVATRALTRGSGRGFAGGSLPQDLSRESGVSSPTRERVRRVRALVLRYLLLLRRDPARVVDTFYWPLIDIAVWGLLTSFVAGRGAKLPNAIGVFLGAAILWNLFFRC